MSSGALSCQRCLGSLKLGLRSLTSRSSTGRPLSKSGLRFPVQCRTLLTAVTSSPSLLESPKSKPQLSVLVDSALEWASKDYTSNDPPSHAIVLIHKSFLPKGNESFLYALGESKQLCGLNSLVGVVDAVGEGAKGVSVLLASSSEGVIIDTLTGSKKEELRVGRWHAKDVETEDDEPMNFDDVMASIRGQASTMRPSVASISNEREFVFAVGEMEGAQSQAENLGQMFPKADIVKYLLNIVDCSWE